jgi:predicted secreted protein
MKNISMPLIVVAILIGLLIPAISCQETVSETPTPTQTTTPIIGRTFTIYATREGHVGGNTSNGHVIQERDHFVALPSSKALCSNGGHEYEVRLTYQGKSVVAPVWDIGPWNTKDDYWNLPSQREAWQDLSQGIPEAQEAYQKGYNGGFDETNYLLRGALNTSH